MRPTEEICSASSRCLSPASQRQEIRTHPTGYKSPKQSHTTSADLRNTAARFPRRRCLAGCTARPNWPPPLAASTSKHQKRLPSAHWGSGSGSAGRRAIECCASETSSSDAANATKLLTEAVSKGDGCSLDWNDCVLQRPCRCTRDPNTDQLSNNHSPSVSTQRGD